MRIANKATVLVWRGKYDTKYFDISNLDKERAVCMQLFRYFNLKGYYSGGVTAGSRHLMTAEEVMLDPVLVKRVLVERSVNQYEDQEFDLVCLENP